MLREQQRLVKDLVVAWTCFEAIIKVYNIKVYDILNNAPPWHVNRSFFNLQQKDKLADKTQFLLSAETAYNEISPVEVRTSAQVAYHYIISLVKTLWTVSNRHTARKTCFGHKCSYSALARPSQHVRMRMPLFNHSLHPGFSLRKRYDYPLVLDGKTGI